MKKSLLLSLICLCTLAVRAQNQCSSALAVTAGTYTVSAINGTEVPNPLCAATGANATAGEWYSYTPTEDHALTVTTDLPANAGGDTRFHVYTGVCGSLTCVGGDDDSGAGYLSIATLNVTAGTTYKIAFDNNWSSAGFDFQIIEGPPVAIPISFTPVTITAVGYPSAVVDMNNDHLDDIVAAGSTNININYQQIGGGFVSTNITTTPADNTPSWSIAAGDLDDNGYNDLMYGGGGGVTFMMANGTGTAFTEVSFPQYVFCQRTNMVDINNDGALDAFSCHDVDANVYYTNDGLGNLTFHQGGLGETCGNYGSIWIDFDNDHDMDLFVAKCGCDPVDILYRNNGDGTFTNIAGTLGFADSHQSWSSAWGDFDDDGDMDVLVGSSSSSYHKLMRNDGDGVSFTNVTAGSGYDVFTGQSIEWTTHDFNNDGYLDILGGGALMLNNGDMTFTMTTITPGNGPIGDLNNDGFLDIVNSTTIYMNDGNSNHYLKVNTIGTASNMNGIGARVEIVSPMGTQIRDVKSGDGFSDMSSLTTHFGLGTDTQIDHVTVYWPSGAVSTVLNPAVDGTLDIVEGSSVGMTEVSTDLGIQLFPSPAQDVLNITANVDLSNAVVTILDIAGKQVIATDLSHDRIDISRLTSGIYMLQVEVGGRIVREEFAKE